jgi:hypothetical protein
MAVEPGAGLLHGVAVLDSIDGIGHFNPFQMPCELPVVA